jgi:hypothetical protein
MNGCPATVAALEPLRHRGQKLACPTLARQGRKSAAAARRAMLPWPRAATSGSLSRNAWSIRPIYSNARDKTGRPPKHREQIMNAHPPVRYRLFEFLKAASLGEAAYCEAACPAPRRKRTHDAADRRQALHLRENRRSPHSAHLQQNRSIYSCRRTLGHAARRRPVRRYFPS